MRVNDVVLTGANQRGVVVAVRPGEALVEVSGALAGIPDWSCWWPAGSLLLKGRPASV